MLNATQRSVLVRKINRVGQIIAEAKALEAELQLQCSPHNFNDFQCVYCGAKVSRDSSNIIRLQGEQRG